MPYQTERKRELFMAEKNERWKSQMLFCHKSEDQVRKLIAGPEGVLSVMSVLVSAQRLWRRNWLSMIQKMFMIQTSIC